MPADTEYWIELTEFDHCEPSALAFRAIVALLDTWPADDQAAAIGYADKLLSKWPDSVRLAPWSWCKAASKGAVQPTWQLVRALQLTTNHLSKGTVNLVRLAHHASLEHITELEVPFYSDFQELSFLYHRPEAFPALKKLRAADKYDDGDVRALAESPLWRTLETLEINDLTDSLVHRKDGSRIVPQFHRPSHIRHLTLRSPDLIAVWNANNLPQLRSASVFIRSIDEALTLAARAELSQLTSLSIAFRCGFSGSSPFEPFLGNIIEADEAAADAFFSNARLDQLEKLAIVGYSMGYWGREGTGRLGLDALIASGLLQRLKHVRLQLLPLGDKGVAALAPALGKQLETLELQDVYCKGDGAAALNDSPCMSCLRHLDLSANRIDAEHFVRMAEVDMPHLQRLDLSGPPINPYYWNVGQQPLLDTGAAAWANSANSKQLKRLRLNNCHLTDEALTAIFQSSQLRNLEELDLSHNSFTATAISQAVVGSLLWQTLKELGLNDCRLDNAAMEVLSRVNHAPALRSLQLGYNSIGPKGAAALANWPVLARVWRLELHDNVIGDEGLIALAESPNLGRLLELDFEQDCWNSRKFTFNDNAARALATSRSLPRLDSLYSGCVDEHHGTAYSPGFTKSGLDAVRKSASMRPAFKAACSDFSGVSEYFESAEFDEKAELGDGDFRRHPFTLNDKEAETKEHRMQQVRLPSGVEQACDDERPPEIPPFLAELDLNDEDVIEGLEFREPTPSTDISLRLNLSLEDSQRPLPNQVGKLISDTLRSIFKASSLGHFQTSGSSSTVGEDGRAVPTDVSFSLGIKGDPQPAVQLIRETFWWVGAPGDTDLDEFPLALAKEPLKTASRFLQLATPKIARWKFGDEAGHRIDRVPFSAAQREGIQRILREASATEPAEGRVEVATSDGGRMAIYIKYLNESADFDTLNILVEELTSEISCLIHKLMQECAFMLLPMAFAASVEVARTIDCDWPKVELVASAATLHELLARGPYHWWSTRTRP
jgi:Ran GTPase-activating protein (RanGAP) involved in mRNA processing and transport